MSLQAKSWSSSLQRVKKESNDAIFLFLSLYVGERNNTRGLEAYVYKHVRVFSCGRSKLMKRRFHIFRKWRSN